MNSYVGTPLRHGIVQHGLGTMEIIVSLWRLNEDGSRTLVPAAVDILTENMIKVDIVAGDCVAGTTYSIHKMEREYVVVVVAP